MKTHVKIFSVACFAALLLAASDAFSEVRTWKSTAGTSIEAEFVSKFGNSITLRTPQGRSFVVPIASLAPESQAQIPTETSSVASGSGMGTGARAGVATMPGASSSRPRPIGGLQPPSAEEIAAFKTETTEADGSRISLQASFHPRSLSKKDAEKASRLGKIPFRVTCVFAQHKLVSGRMRRTMLSGNAYIVILNEQGEVIASKRENLSKLCPS